jgi:hypothetical protein
MAASTPETAFPQAIAKAVIEVMSALGTLGKEHENKEGGKYMYASIDDFIAHVRGHCIAAGLFIIPNEDDPARVVDMMTGRGPRAMWLSRFAFTLVHQSGEAYGPIYKTVMVYATGAQAAGSAQSYAMKQLMRGLFQIKTGDDDDPDKEKVEIRHSGDEETDLQKQAGRIRRAILGANDLDELGLIWSDNSVTLDHIKLRSETAYEFLTKEYHRKKELIENG